VFITKDKGAPALCQPSEPGLRQRKIGRPWRSRLLRGLPLDPVASVCHHETGRRHFCTQWDRLATGCLLRVDQSTRDSAAAVARATIRGKRLLHCQPTRNPLGKSAKRQPRSRERSRSPSSSSTCGRWSSRSNSPERGRTCSVLPISPTAWRFEASSISSPGGAWRSSARRSP